MSATPEQIADWLIIVAVGDAANEYTNRAEHMRAAAATLRAQAERVRVLELALKRTHQTLCVPAAEYVPAIRDCFDIIDAALKAAP